MDSHEFTPVLCILKWLLAKGPVSLFPCPSPRSILRKPESRFPRELDTYPGMEQITVKGVGQSSGLGEHPERKGCFGHCQEPPYFNTPRALPHPISLPMSKNNLLLALLCSPLLQPTASQPASASQSSASQHPHLTRTSPPLMAALMRRSKGHRAACRLTQGQVVCSDLSRLVSESQGARCGRLTGLGLRPAVPRKQQPPGTAPGLEAAQRRVEEHRERGGVW